MTTAHPPEHRQAIPLVATVQIQRAGACFIEGVQMSIVRARKSHVCTLCHGEIEAKTDYVYETIRIWDHPENDCFGVYKAHIDCDETWRRIGSMVDWIFPYDASDWQELIS